MSVSVRDRAASPHTQPCRPSFRLRDGVYDDTAGENDAVPVSRAIHFAPRTLIFLEGDPVDWAYQIEAGTVILYKLLPDGRRQIVELVGASDVFGISSLPVHDCAAETLAPTHCTAFDRAVVERSPTLTRRLSARLYMQLGALREHTLLLGRKSAAERLASFLMQCVPDRGGHGCSGPPAGADHTSIRIAMTRQEIADYLGLTIETVSRTLTKLKRRGVLSIGRLGEIEVPDVCRMCSLTGAHLTRDGWCSSREDDLIKDPWS